MITVQYKTLDKKRNLIYTIFFLVGVLFAVVDFYLIGVTIINYRIPFLILFITAFISQFLDFKNYIKVYKFPSSYETYFFSFGQNLFTWGAFVVFLFISANYFIQIEDYRIVELDVVDSYQSNGGKGKRHIEAIYLYIEYNSNKESIHFKETNHSEIEKVKSIELELRDGFLGYGIYKNPQIVWKNN
jgi:hypothetical protein